MTDLGTDLALGIGRSLGDYLTADIVNATTTAVDVADLSFTVEAGKTYRFEYDLVYIGSIVGVGLQVAMYGPTFSMLAINSSLPNSSTANLLTRAANAYDGFTNGTVVPIALQEWLAKIIGLITPTANGVLGPRFKASSANAITQRAGSTGTLTRIT